MESGEHWVWKGFLFTLQVECGDEKVVDNLSVKKKATL